MPSNQEKTQKDITHIEDLTPDPNNANRGTQRGSGLLERSLRMRGAGRSVLADRNGVLIAGNKTVEKAAEIGLPIRPVHTDGNELVVVIRDDWDLEVDEAPRIMAFEDNYIGQVSLDWDPAVLELAKEQPIVKDLFTPVELDKILSSNASLNERSKASGNVEQSAAKALNEKWQVEKGQLWYIGPHRLLCADCTDVEAVHRLFGDEKPDAVFTSPPYGVGISYGEYQDTIENLRALLPKVAHIWRELLVPGGYAVVNFNDIATGQVAAGAPSDTPTEYPMSLEYYPVFQKEGFVLWSRRVWCKPTARVNALWCVNTNRAATDFEHVWTFKAPGKAIIARVDGTYSSVNGWFDTTQIGEHVSPKDEHGAGFPMGLAARMVFIHTRREHIVYEPFCGTGTTIAAAAATDRYCYATELNPESVAVSLERMSELGFTPRLVHGLPVS